MQRPHYYLKNKKNGTALLHMRYKVSNDHPLFYYSWGLRVPIQHWNAETQRLSPSYRRARNLNRQLKKARDLVLDTVDELIAKEEEVTKDKLKARLDKFFQRKTLITARKRKRYVDELMKSHCEEVAALIGKGTLKKKKNVIRRFEAFQDWQSKRYVVSQLDHAFLERFIIWGYSIGSQTSTLQMYLKEIKGMLNDAKRKKKHSVTEYNDLRIKTLLPKKTTRKTDAYLSLKHIEQIKQTDVGEAYQVYKDVLLVLYYTGLRYEDYYNANESSFVEVEGRKGELIPCWRNVNEKTNMEIINPIPQTLTDVLKKYNYQLPKLADTVLNRGLKDVCHLAGIDQIFQYVDDKGGVVNHYAVPLYSIVTCYTLRRSFNTNMDLLGIPLHLRSHAMGHTSITTTRRYDKATSEDVARQLSAFAFFQ